MDVLLWIVAALLAVAFLGAGSAKLLKSKHALQDGGMAWVEDFSQPVVRGIGVAEVSGALGLVLPALTGIAPALVPIAATGLALLMAGAVLTHLRRREFLGALPATVLTLLSAFVAWGRFGDWSF